MSTRAPARVVDDVQRAVARAATPEQVFEAAGTALRTAVPYDGAMWFAVDPATLLTTAPGMVEGLDPGYCDVFWHREFHDHDANLFHDLVRNEVPAASLRAATDDRPSRSVRFREFLSPQGFDDELRAVFRTGESTWAIGALLREKGRPAFDAIDVSIVGAVTAVVATALRTHTLVAATPRPLVGGEAPGLLVFDRDGRLKSANAEAARWLSDVYGTDDWVGVLTRRDDDLAIPFPVIPLLLRARSVADGVEPGPARLRLRDRQGRWLVLHASCLAGTDGASDVAVVVEPAKSAEIAPIVIEAYGLSPRERDVVRAIARGSSTPEIASELFLSPHTVRDYVKTVFEKVGVSSRGELVAKLFAEHYSDPFHESLVSI